MIEVNINDGGFWLSPMNDALVKQRAKMAAHMKPKATPVSSETLAYVEAIYAAAKKAEAGRVLSPRRVVLIHQNAIRLLDASESEMLSTIERDLSKLHGRARVSVVNATITRLMGRLRRIREAAIKATFRYIRDNMAQSKPAPAPMDYGRAAKMLLNDEMGRVEAIIRSSLASGTGPRVIGRRIVGSSGLGGVDGTTEITRRKVAQIGVAAIKRIPSTR